jgi:carbonic anhydrase
MALERVRVTNADDVLPEYRGTPIAEFFGYHAMGWPDRSYAHAELLIVTCMDCRIGLRIPRTFAYVLRTAGASARCVEFNVEFAVAVAGVPAIAVIGHDDCAMTKVRGKKDEFVRGLASCTGCSSDDAAGSFDAGVDRFAIDDAVGFAVEEAERLAARFPQVVVAPLFYDVRTGEVTQIRKT